MLWYQSSPVRSKTLNAPPTILWLVIPARSMSLLTFTYTQMEHQQLHSAGHVRPSLLEMLPLGIDDAMSLEKVKSAKQ